jgi:glycosyltransferase involved in cell wall biosynthesis
MLLDVVRSRFADQVELDIVTRDDVPEGYGARVHRAEPNSPLLRELYARADLFVLPTRAECFGIAVVEAMASGLPVIFSDVGAARDIVDDGSTGWLIEPSAPALARALEQALENRARLPEMGRAARQVAVTRFDGKRNDDRLVGLILEQAEAFRAQRADGQGRRSTARPGTP